MNSLQSMILPRHGFPHPLYIRAGDGVEIVPAAAGREAGDEPGTIALPAGAGFSTDTYFNTFYLSYWRKFAAIGDLGLRIELAGQAVVRVCDTTGWGDEVVLRAEIGAETPTTFDLELPPLSRSAPFASGGPFRRYVEVEATTGCTVSHLAFTTPDAPQREVSLSLGLCTFNQEAMLARTLGRLEVLAAGDRSIRRIFVVNQGAPFASEEIRRITSGPRFTVIAQRNLGGCGGFTRSLIEAVEAPDAATHHLLMDDDIVLDERVIARAVRFLEFARQDIAVGAPMLDSLRPTTMYEAGAFIRDDNRLQPYCHNVDMRPPAALANFDMPVATDYNAWWFCVLPLARCRAVRYPTPIFIRGDDFEYGQRLAADNVPTVTLPGTAVWHDPFYAKPSGWQDYYDLRNRLIFAATYPGRVSQLSPAHVTGSITTEILKHNYLAAELRLRAVEDFLAGPEATLGRDGAELHGEIMALARADAPEPLQGAAWQARPAIAPPPQRQQTMRRLVFGQLVSMLATGLGPLRPDDDPVLIDRAATPLSVRARGYVLTNGARTFHLRYRPDRRRLWSLLRRAAAVALRYRRSYLAAGGTWRAGVAAYQGREAWRQLFDKAP